MVFLNLNVKVSDEALKQIAIFGNGDARSSLNEHNDAFEQTSA